MNATVSNKNRTLTSERARKVQSLKQSGLTPARLYYSLLKEDQTVLKHSI